MAILFSMRDSVAAILDCSSKEGQNMGTFEYALKYMCGIAIPVLYG